jgi:hypothetical protein
MGRWSVSGVLGLALLAVACGQKAPVFGPVPATADSADVPPKADPSAPVVLPLRTGYYIASEDTCEIASSVSLQLLGRSRISTSHVECTFESIVQRASSTFGVTVRCTDDGKMFGREPFVETRTDTFDVARETQFTIGYDGGGSATYQFCEQASLPEPWRTNDISDLIK